VRQLEEFLAELRQLGVSLRVEGDKLKVRAGEDVLTPELTEALKQRKAEILALLRPKPVYSIDPLPPRDCYELSASQRRLWILAQLPEGSAAYNIPLHQFLEGPLDRAALEQAFARLVKRHQSLRTTFIVIDDEPRQVVRPDFPAAIEFRDLAGAQDPAGMARQLGRRDAARPFDLEAGPLWRIRLLRLAPQQHIMVFTIHHLIADGVSLSVLARDLSHLYESARSGRPDNLPALGFGYPAFAAWHNRLLGDELMASHRRYWHAMLSGELPLLNLPTDYPRPPVQRFRGRELGFRLDAEPLKVLRAFARRHNATLFMAVHAMLKVLLFAYSGQQDIIVGCAIAGREHPDLANQVGLYLNTLALRSRMSGETSFEDFLSEVARLTMDAFDHQVYPFDQLVGELNLGRDLSRSPLFDVMLIEQSQDEPGLDLNQLKSRPVFEHTDTSKFDLTFSFKALPGLGLLLGIEYSTDLFSEDRIRRMGGHFLQLVKSVLADPSQAIGRLNVLPDHERDQLVLEFNRTAAPCPAGLTIVDLLESAAAERPEAVALACGPQQMSYRELHARANQLAWHLRDMAMKAGDTVGICMERSPELVVALLAVLKAGAAYVPLDPRHPAGRLADIIEDAHLSVLITSGDARRLSKHRSIRSIDLRADRSKIARHRTEPPPRHIEPEHLAYVIYTSGTSGRPKGVEIPHLALTNFLLAMSDRPGLSHRDVLLAVTTISFDIAALEIYLPLARHARLVLAEDDDVVEGVRLMSLMQRSGATVMQATPSTWQMLLNAGWQGNPVFTVICGGEALPGWLAEQLLARAGSVWNMYGPTETTVWSSLCKLDRNDTPRDAVEPIGRPIANTEIYILDAQMRPVPLGVAGDLYIAGDGLALGYRNLPELTAQRFLPHPFDRNARRIYHTGDLARYRQNGDIEYLGRSDQQVKLRGFRIELREIEAVLATHPAIRQAVVDARAAAPGDRRLIAWYVGVRGKDAPAEALRNHLRRKLPNYMIPALFIAVAALPRTANGKVDRKALSENGPECNAVSTYEAPRSDWEQTLADLWQSVLNSPKVGIHDNFFELGGHSLKAAALIARLQRETGVRFELVDIFRYPTVAALAAHAVACPTVLAPAAIAPAKAFFRETASFATEADGLSIRPATAEEQEILSRL
jgi:amino acid adenylation domain-containing protein